MLARTSLHRAIWVHLCQHSKLTACPEAAGIMQDMSLPTPMPGVCYYFYFSACP